MNKFTLSAFADEYSDNFVEQCRAMNGFGIPYVEIRHADGKNISEMTKEDVLEMVKKLKDFNLGVSSIGSPIGKIKLDGDVEGHFATAEKIFEYANLFGTKNIRMFSFYLPENKTREDCRNQVIDNIGKLLEIAKKYNVTLCHENEALIYGEGPSQCLDLLKTFNGDLKCVFDMGNFVLDGYNPQDAYELLKDYVEYFHIKDSLYAGAIVPAGKGEANIKEILQKYNDSDKKPTFITLEPHLQTFAGLNALVGKTFDNPYKYADQQTAFTDAVVKLKELL